MKIEQQTIARDLYLNTGKTQQEIADMLNVNRRTVYLWIKNGRWQDMKIAARQAPGIILQDIYNHILAVNDKIRQRDDTDRDPTMQEVEKLRKLIGITATIQKRHTGAYMEAFQELIGFIARNNAELAGNIIPHADNYIRGNFGDKFFYASKERDENIRDVITRLTAEVAVADAGSCQNADVASGDKNGIFCDENSPSSPAAQTMTESAVVQDFIGTEASAAPAEYPNPAIPENATFPASPAEALAKEGHPAEVPLEGCRPGNLAGEEPPKTAFDKIMELPPAQRPSPWRDGNIIWVSNIDDVENRLDNFGNPWGEMKMADSIRHYPDVDPALKRDAAFARMMQELREFHQRKKTAA